LASIHTSFDAWPGGTADALAAAVGLESTRYFGSVDPASTVKIVVFVPNEDVERVAAAMAAAGAGNIGDYRGCSHRSEGTGVFTPVPGANPHVGEVGTAHHEPEVRLEMIAPSSARDRVCAALVAAHPYEAPAFDLYDVTANSGFIGRVGQLPEATNVGELASSVSGMLGSVGVRVSGGHDRPVGSVAVVPGSGGSFVAGARASGADVLVTGDVGHHKVVEALDMGLAVIDVGHTTSERPGMASLLDVVSRAAVEVGAGVVDLTPLDPTPWTAGAI
jgi:hypothetical protein